MGPTGESAWSVDLFDALQPLGVYEGWHVLLFALLLHEVIERLRMLD